MAALAELWMPIVVSAVVVFVASAIAWMVLPHHRGDFKKAPNEEKLMSDVRSYNLAPGQYYFPGCHGVDRNSQEFKDKMAKGPWGMISVMPGPPTMGKSLGTWFVYLLLVGVFVAYITSNAVPAGAEYLRVFQIAGATAFAVHVLACMPAAIWGGKAWSATFKDMIDGVIYALLTAGIFGWMWPAGGAAADVLNSIGG